MVREIRKKNLYLNFRSTLKEMGLKSIGAFIFTTLLIIVIVVTFLQVQKRQSLYQSAAPGDALVVNASNNIRPFSNQMLGQAFVNWEHSWGKPFPNEIPGLSSALKEQGAGLIRYAGGLWANYVGFDRTPQRTPYTNWTSNGRTYSFSYGTNEIDSLNRLADAVGADVMIQVNIASDDPLMWADMVRFTNIESGFDFKYWELGNEFDVDTELGITPEMYADRVKRYVDAMKDVDPSIQIIAGVPGTAHDAPRQGWNDSITDLSHYLTLSAQGVSAKGRKPDALSYHWYQACNSTSITDLINYRYDGLATNSWRNSYSRIWSQIAPSRVKNEIIQNQPMRQGITELNFDACNYDNTMNGNHMNALWASDIIGRLAYNGLDYITWYEGYANQGYSTLYADNADSPTKLFLRPSYNAFFMYNKYFGNQLVESRSFNDANISIWASKDTRDPNKLKLRITNMTANDISVPVELSGFNATNGQVYIMRSTNPTDVTSASNIATSPTTINGVRLDASNIVSTSSQIQPVVISVNGTTFTYNFPAYTTTAIVLSEGSATTPTPTSIINPTIIQQTPTTVPSTPTTTPTPTQLPLTPTAIPATPTNTLAPTPTRTPTPLPTAIPTSIPTATVTPTKTPAQKSDFNNDGKVDIQDLSFLLTRWGTADTTADINKDGKVTIIDLSVVLSNWSN